MIHGMNGTFQLAPGTQARFLYPAEFVTLSEYSAKRGAIVTVIRPCTEDEAEGPSPDMEPMYLVRDMADGWEGFAWEGELDTLDA